MHIYSEVYVGKAVLVRALGSCSGGVASGLAGVPRASGPAVVALGAPCDKKGTVKYIQEKEKVYGGEGGEVKEGLIGTLLPF